MKINILNLKEGKTEYFEKYNENTLDLKGLEFSLIGQLNAHIVIEKWRGKVKLSLEADFTLKMQCSRCLEHFERSFHEEATFYLKAGKEEVKAEKSLKDEDIYTLFYATDEIDVTPLIRDMVILVYPMKPLCKPDCKGLCPVCGVNLNKMKCHHEQVTIDPRWSKLLEIKKKISKA